ncbi:MAG TPA: OsmC family protein [Ideonella sp.]|nr:OsmC family protein [Ideonella sp.]
MDVSVAHGEGPLQQVITIGPHRLLADAPVANGGQATGPEPHDILAAALGACTALTVTLYARHKQIALQDVQVRIAHGPQDGGYVFTKHIAYVGTLSAEQRERLTQIADRCPVHRTLSGTIRIETVVA